MAERAPMQWEAQESCPTCKAKVGQQCVTLRPQHITPTVDEKSRVGTPTNPHKARIVRWTKNQERRMTKEIFAKVADEIEDRFIEESMVTLSHRPPDPVAMGLLAVEVVRVGARIKVLREKSRASVDNH